LPSGRLREPRRSLKRADAIVLIGESGNFPSLLPSTPREVPVFHARKVIKSTISTQGLAVEIKAMRILAFCGLANPESFVQSLKQTGSEIADFIEFNDHHIYQTNDVERIVRAAKIARCDAAVTTLKDLVKLERIWPEDIPLIYLEISIQLENEPQFFRLIGV